METNVDTTTISNIVEAHIKLEELKHQLLTKPCENFEEMLAKAENMHELLRASYEKLCFGLSAEELASASQTYCAQKEQLDEGIKSLEGQKEREENESKATLRRAIVEMKKGNKEEAEYYQQESGKHDKREDEISKQIREKKLLYGVIRMYADDLRNKAYQKSANQKSTGPKQA